jgi:hypothetical protein
MVKALTVCLLLLSSLPAQIVRLANYSTMPWSGWSRVTVDKLPPGAGGDLMVTDGTSNVPVASYILGRQIGLETWMVDVKCALGPGEKRTLDLSKFASFKPPQLSLPADLLAHFGGSPSVNGVALALGSLRADGACWLSSWRARVPGTRMLACELWVWWNPQQPWSCHGEALVTASNPAVPDMGEVTPPITLTWGDAVVTPIAGAAGELLPEGTALADGQAKAMPLTFSWSRHLPACDWSNPWGEDEWRTIAAILSTECAKGWQPCGVGIEKLLADGNPSYAGGFTPGNFVASFGESARRLRTWEPNLYGPAMPSGSTGAQEDQTFVRGEFALPGGEGAELVTWLNGIKLHAERPCNHLEIDGGPLDDTRHTSPRLLFWDGRVHGSSVVSPERLGKPRGITLEEAHGRYGPDVEHFLANTLTAACRLTGSPVAQRLLRNLCTVYLLQRTLPASWSTSTEGIVTRATGWEGIFVTHVWRDLEDREMAQRVADRWRARWTTLIGPKLAAQPNDIWDVRTETSAAVPIVPGWMPWQQAIAAYGIDLACAQVGPEEGRQIALRGALRTLDCYFWETDRWVDYERLSLAGDKSRSGFYAYAWLPCAPAVVLRHQPTHEKARSVWTQVNAANGSRSWLPPGVPQ